jgi:hypothetical protein
VQLRYRYTRSDRKDRHRDTDPEVWKFWLTSAETAFLGTAVQPLLWHH